VLLAREPVLDNRPLEARADVVTYSTAPLPETVEAIGPVGVELFVRAGSPHFDLFARVCDVEESGVSWNVCDGLSRVAPERFGPAAGGAVRVAFELWPMGHRFAAGHRIRLQVSSGAHPRYARNPGTGEDFAAATVLRAVDIEVLHDAEYPSVLVLPASPAGAPQR
jgi:putative CocE/NonD family hydrolase